MYRKICVSLMCLFTLLCITHLAVAQSPITGPWLWIIAPNGTGQGGAASINVDSLSVASQGAVTETDIATNGAQDGDIIGNYAWTPGELRTAGIDNTLNFVGEIDNVTDLLKRLGWADGEVLNHSSYALIILESAVARAGVTMKVGSDDAIKVWLNGAVVHTNPVDRGSGGFQDTFVVDLKQGDNLLLVKVSQGWGNWSMFAGVDAPLTHKLPGISLSELPEGTPTLPEGTPTDADPSLILYFSFDELNGNQAIDHSQYQNHGTLVGNPQLVDGKFGKALKLNGESDWVEVPHHDSLTVDTDVTVMAWIHTPRYHGPGGASWQGIVGKSNNPRSYSFYTEADGQLHLSVSAFIGSSSDEKISLNEWQHVVAQVNSGWHRYWINGKNVGNFQIDASLPGKADTAPVLIGNTHDILPARAPNRQFLGLIDEVRIYNRALSEAEILQQMGQGLQPRVRQTPLVENSDTILSFSPSPVPSPDVGQQLSLDLNITGGENIAGYQATVEFDAAKLRFVSSENSDYLPTGAFAVPAIVKGNTVIIAATSLAGEKTGDGTLATLTFEVSSAEASTLTITEALLTDTDGNIHHPQVESGQITEPDKLKADVNGDGTVNIQDLVLVASNFGATGENPADVNGDGVVNIIDLTLVAGALGEAAAAPAAHATSLENLTATEVAQWIQAAQQANLTDPAFQRGIEVLKNLLALLVPKETMLLANYPNPFNPETWIPYQLATPAEVTLHIHAVDGSLIRTLSLGHKPIGMYQNRNRAAYWDGRNQIGEPVASGVYFYTLTAGDFTATRKMLIRK